MPHAAILLAAGKGTRLAPLSNEWPKCLMPIGDRPLLDYWLFLLRRAGVSGVFVNTHTHAEHVKRYLERPMFADWATPYYEQELLGTAGTVRALAPYLGDEPVLVAHADNLIDCDLDSFFEAHRLRSTGTVITMMTFASPNPRSCGIVEVNAEGVVERMEEKPADPKSSMANAAVYIFDREVIDLIVANESISDLSTELLPRFMGRIQAWHNGATLRDIGSPEQLTLAQRDKVRQPDWPEDAWQRWFNRSEQIADIRGFLNQ